MPTAKRLALAIVFLLFLSGQVYPEEEKGRKGTGSSVFPVTEEVPAKGTGEAAINDDVFKAAASGDLKTLESKISKDPSLVRIRDKNGANPLHYAACNGQVQAVGFLLSRGADAKAADFRDLMPLGYENEQSLRISSTFTAIGANTKRSTESGLTPLHFAALAGHNKSIVLRFEVPVDNKPTKMDMTLTGKESKPEGKEYKKIAEMLVSKGADVNALTYGNRFGPLHVAAFYGNTEMVEYLISEGADVNTPVAHGETALHFAAQNGHLETVKILLTKGAKTDVRDRWDGQTPLHLAVLFNRKEVVTLLISHGVDVNAKDSYGKTALHTAELLKHSEMAELLKKYGATK